MTPWDKIYDQALSVIRDYRIDNLARTDEDAFYLYMESLLKVGLPEFYGCLHSLDYELQIDIDNKKKWNFKEDLDRFEIGILAKIIVLKWSQSKIQDVVAFEGKIPLRDFKAVETSTMLKQKYEYVDRLQEDIDNDITRYQLEHISELPFFGGV